MDEPSSALDVFSEQELFHHVTVFIKKPNRRCHYSPRFIPAGL